MHCAINVSGQSAAHSGVPQHHIADDRKTLRTAISARELHVGFQGTRLNGTIDAPLYKRSVMIVLVSLVGVSQSHEQESDVTLTSQTRVSTASYVLFNIFALFV